jgi:hypothetical protein
MWQQAQGAFQRAVSQDELMNISSLPTQTVLSGFLIEIRKKEKKRYIFYFFILSILIE